MQNFILPILEGGFYSWIGRFRIKEVQVGRYRNLDWFKNEKILLFTISIFLFSFAIEVGIATRYVQLFTRRDNSYRDSNEADRGAMSFSLAVSLIRD